MLATPNIVSWYSDASHIYSLTFKKTRTKKEKGRRCIFIHCSVILSFSCSFFFSSYKCRLFNLFLVCSHLFDKHNSKELWSTYYSRSTCWSKFFTVLTLALVKLKFTSITAWSWIPVKSLMLSCPGCWDSYFWIAHSQARLRCSHNKQYKSYTIWDMHMVIKCQ